MKAYSVLIADDEPLVARSIADCLDWTGLGFCLMDSCHDGLAALNAVREHRPDVVLTDIRMPGINGLELMRALSEECPDTQIILISGYAEFDYAQEAMRRNALAYLLKPIDQEELREALERARGRLERAPACEKRSPMEAGLSPTLQHAVDYVQGNICEKLSLHTVAHALYISPTYLSQLFRRELNTTFTQYLSERRIALACEMLREPGATIASVACALGYADYFYFSRVFKKVMNQSPGSYQNAIRKGTHS